MGYTLTSDQHAHSWSQFASTDSEGVNTRLKDILRELERAAESAHARGHRRVYGAGDLFHVRGSVKPSVINPVRSTLVALSYKYGVEWRLLAGNHDLESNESTQLGNAVEALAMDGRIEVISKPWYYTDDNVVMIPWIPKLDDLFAAIQDVKDYMNDQGESPLDFDLIIHAGIDGVLSGVPHHGLTASKLADLGFRNVFAGHYHHHCEFPNCVFSIGALTHQTWSDVGTKAGFLTVSDDGDVAWSESSAPKFVELTGEEDEDELRHAAAGNFLKVKGDSWSEEEIKTIRRTLMDMGAAGVVIHATPKTTVTPRAGGSAASASSLESSVGGYIEKAELASDDPKRVSGVCMDILSEARTAA